MDDFIILSLAQVQELLADIDDQIELARRGGYAEGRKAEAEFKDADVDEAYDDGFEHGHAQGYDEGYNEGAADSYDDGYEDGYADGREHEVTLADIAVRAADEAFDEQPRIHSWPEGAAWG